MNKNIEEERNLTVSIKKSKKKCEISKMRNKNDYNPELFCITYIQHNKQMIFLKFYGKVGFKSWLDFSS